MSSVLVAQVYLFYGPRKSNFFRDFTQYRSYFAVQLFTSKTQTNLWINDLDFDLDIFQAGLLAESL